MAKVKDFKKYTGVSLRKHDLLSWTDTHFLAWFGVMHHFTIDKKLTFNEVTLQAFRQKARENDLWNEWMHRAEAHIRDYVIAKISGRILNMNRVIGTFLQSNPHVITTQMKGMMEANPYLEKYAQPFTTETTKIGAEIVTPNTNDLDRFTMPEVQYHEALLRMSKVANELLGSVTKADLKKMSPKDRLTLANALIQTMSKVQGGQKPNMQIFKQLVIHQAGRQELESALLAYQKD